MAVSQIFDENYISSTFLNPELEVSKLTFSGGDENPVRVGATHDVDGLASIGIGYQASTSGDHSIAIGHDAQSGSGSIALGHEADSSGAEHSIAIGAQVNAYHSDCIVLSCDGQQTAHKNQIILSTTAINPPNTAEGFYVTNVRQNSGSTYRNLIYNQNSGEVFYEPQSGDDQLQHDSGTVIFKDLPTSDPENEGQLWVDDQADFVLKVSQGSD